MAAKKHAAPQDNTHTLAPELCDIPLSLEQGDVRSQKAKSNSLKRFFRKSKSQINEDVEATRKDSVSLQLRFGMFRKNDGGKNTANDIASGSSKSIASESKPNLPERLSCYWNNVFKRAPKKIQTAASDQGGDAPPAVVPPTEDNSLDI